MARCGHGELLMLFGILMALTGYVSFERVGLKGDLGALVFGMLVAAHPKAAELAERLLSFKDLLLVCFFLNIGICGSPTLTGLLIAVALSITFIVAAPLNSAAHTIYARISNRIKKFETEKRLPDDRPIDTGDAEIAVIGMGVVGTSAYDVMNRRYGDIVIGIDFDSEKVKKHRETGRNVFHGDAGDSDFWERIEPANSRVILVMLALPDPRTSVFAIQQMKEKGYPGQITASVNYEDEMHLLKTEGIDAVYSLYEEAGLGFADHVCDHMDYCRIKMAE